MAQTTAHQDIIGGYTPYHRARMADGYSVAPKMKDIERELDERMSKLSSFADSLDGFLIRMMLPVSAKRGPLSLVAKASKYFYDKCH